MPILDEEDGDVTRVRPLARAALGSSDIAAGDIKDGNAEQDAPAERHRWGGSKWSIKGLSPRSSRLLSSFAAPLDDLMELLLLGTSGSGFAVTKGIATRMSQRRWGLNRGILLES